MMADQFDLIEQERLRLGLVNREATQQTPATSNTGLTPTEERLQA
jgi:hypothetical protein